MENNEVNTPVTRHVNAPATRNILITKTDANTEISNIYTATRGVNLKTSDVNTAITNMK